MKVLIAGATGLIGHALAQALLRRGHTVVGTSRTANGGPPGAAMLAVDFNHPPKASWWAPHLHGVDVVVNAVGIFEERNGATFDAIHGRGPAAMFSAAVGARVWGIVQLSALGSDSHATTPFPPVNIAPTRRYVAFPFPR